MPSPQAEALVTKQRKLIVKTYGAKGRQIIADAQAYADGVNAYCEGHGDHAAAGHGQRRDRGDRRSSARSSAPAAAARRATPTCSPSSSRGSAPVRGYKAWDDVMLADDPEAPTTIKKRFNYPAADRRRA